MLYSFLLFVGGSLLQILSSIFGVIEFFIPDAFSDAIAYVVSYLGYWQGIFPISTMLSAVATFVTFLTGYAIVKLVLWGYHLIPGIGKKTSLPKLIK